MSMNQYMHPRNIYKKPPNFKELAIQFPEFRNHVNQDISGKIILDFKDVHALRALTCTLLKKDFDLDVEIPLDKLIPTVPLRLNYVLWIEDLLSISKKDGEIRGIDIGCGASCVYPLMAAKRYGWKMIATEIDDASLEYARGNVQKNNLESLINVVKVDKNALLLAAIGADSTETYDFCMCNPPFFASAQELNSSFKSRKESRPRPRNAFCANVNEVVATGGEVEFLTRLIKESEQLKERIRIYSTMIGLKSSLNQLKKLLREVNVVSFKQTEFCQGHTTRWGLAWTFCDIDLRKVPEVTLAASRKLKPKQPFKHVVSNKNVDVKEVSEKIEKIMHDLLISFEKLKSSKNVVAYNFIATKNTWSHQRRKRREKQNTNTLLDDEISNDGLIKMDVGECSQNTETTTTCICNRATTPDVENALNKLAEVRMSSPVGGAKREHEDDDDDEGYYRHKRVKTSVGGCKCHQNEFYLKAMLIVRCENEEVSVEMSWLEGTENRELLHQIMQYIKNNLKLSEQ